jgi:cupin fold WbuC family metalloprotein
MKLIRQSADVFLAPGPISTIGDEEIVTIRNAAMASEKGRARINTHPGSEDALHEMVIAIRQDSYIRPHRHLGKSEAFHIVQGAVDIVIFEDSGELRDVVRLGAPGGNQAFYYRLSMPLFHTLLIRSDMLVVHEITNGPFVPNATLFAAFSPEESDRTLAKHFLGELDRRVTAFAGRI